VHLNRRIKIQLAVFIVVAVVAATVMIFGYIKLPANLLGVGRYTVTVELPESGGLYRNGNVTYSGTTVGRVEQVRLTDSGAEAVLSLDSNFQVPSDVDAAVHSQSRDRRDVCGFESTQSGLTAAQGRRGDTARPHLVAG